MPPVPQGENGAAKPVSAADFASRDALLAGMDDLDADVANEDFVPLDGRQVSKSKTASKATAKKTSQTSADEANLNDAEPDAADEEEVEQADDDAADPNLDEEDDDGGEVKDPDPEDGPEDDAEWAKDKKPDANAAKAEKDLAKRLDAVRKAEKRAKTELAAERTEFRREMETGRAELAAARAEVAEFEKLKDRARYDLGSVLAKLGLGEDDFEAASKSLYAMSKAGKADPRARAAVERTSREREAADRLAKVEKELADRKAADAAREAQAEQAQAMTGYLDEVVGAAKDLDAPLLKRSLASPKAAAKARATLENVSRMLARRDGDIPDADDVIAEYERVRRAELEEDDVDIDAYLAGKPAAAAAVAATAKAGAVVKKTKTLGAGGGKTAVRPASKAKTMEELDAEILRDLESDELT